jgi:hypothetical protein
VHKLILEIQQRKIKKKNFKKLKQGHKTIKNMNVLFYDSDTNVVVQWSKLVNLWLQNKNISVTHS